MGTRADFYVGRGPDAEWIGSVTWDGNPGGIAHDSTPAGYKVFPDVEIEEPDYRLAVGEFLEQRDDATLPTEPWPWPWADSGTTDYAYAWDGGMVYGTSSGHGWWPVRLSEECCGEPSDEDAPPSKVAFPDMSDRKGDLGHIMAKSGMIIVTQPGQVSDA